VKKLSNQGKLRMPSRMSKGKEASKAGLESEALGKLTDEAKNYGTEG
jgi:hypothetical protein